MSLAGAAPAGPVGVARRPVDLSRSSGRIRHESRLAQYPPEGTARAADRGPFRRRLSLTDHGRSLLANRNHFRPGPTTGRDRPAALGRVHTAMADYRVTPMTPSMPNTSSLARRKSPHFLPEWGFCVLALTRAVHSSRRRIDRAPDAGSSLNAPIHCHQRTVDRLGEGNICRVVAGEIGAQLPDARRQ